MTTTRFGRDVIGLVIGTPTALKRCQDTVISTQRPQDFELHCVIFDKPGYIAEIAYTYRYVINNGRKEGLRWSVRQTAVYQKMNVETRCSTWILIQPNDFALNRFKAMILLSQDESGQSMTSHLAFLSAAQMDWKMYISHLRLSLQDLVRYRQLLSCRKYVVTTTGRQGMLLKSRQRASG